MNQTYMKDKPIFPLVLTMSLPMVMSMLVNSLYNIVDSYFVAQINQNAMTALSLIFPLQNLVTAVGVGFGIGINAVVAFFLGAGNTASANRTVTQGLILNTVHGVLLTFLCIAGTPLFLKLFTSDAEIISYSLEYSNIVFAFSTAVTLGVSFEKIFQSVGKMKISMISMMSGCIINIVLDPLLIFGIGFFPELGIRGAALATVIGQVASLLIYIVIFLKGTMPVHFQLEKGVMKEKIFVKIYAVGIPAALNLALSSLLITALNGILAAYSQMYVLILGIYYKLQTFIYLTANGIVQGIRPLVGYNYGAGRNDRVLAIHRVALRMGVVIMIVGTALCFLIPKQIIGLFSSDAQTIAAGAKALTIISYGFVISSISVMASGTFEGLGRGIPSLVLSLIRYIAIIPIAFIMSLIFGAVGVWHSFWITEAIAAIVACILMQVCINREIKK